MANSAKAWSLTIKYLLDFPIFGDSRKGSEIFKLNHLHKWLKVTTLKSLHSTSGVEIKHGAPEKFRNRVWHPKPTRRSTWNSWPFASCRDDHHNVISLSQRRSWCPYSFLFICITNPKHALFGITKTALWRNNEHQHVLVPSRDIQKVQQKKERIMKIDYRLHHAEIPIEKHESLNKKWIAKSSYPSTIISMQHP